MVGEQQVGEADDRGQHVVEVVRDAAGELADRLHLLALRELLLERALLGDVEGVDDRRLLVAGAVLDRIDVEAGAAVALGGDGGVDRPGLRRAPAMAASSAAVELVAVGPRDEVDQAPAAGHRLALGRSRRAQEGRVGAPDAAAAVDRRDRDRRVVEEAGEADLGGAERLGDVLAGAAVEDQRAGRAGRAVGGDRHAVEKPDRQALAVPLDEVEVDDLGAVAPAARRAAPGGARRRRRGRCRRACSDPASKRARSMPSHSASVAFR